MAPAGKTIRKLSKADVDYGEGMPHCGLCKHWIESAEDEKTENGACEIVAGAVDEDAWCKLFKPKRKPTLAETAPG
jgi:hypothetical protein